jgi:hypothetical protein
MERSIGRRSENSQGGRKARRGDSSIAPASKVHMEGDE